MAGPTDEDALTFRVRQVAELRGLLAQKSAEFDEVRWELDVVREELTALRAELGSVTSAPPARPAPGRRKKLRWRDRIR